MSALSKPLASILQRAFKIRKGGRASPVLIVVIYPTGISFCGTSGDQPPIFEANDISQAEHLCSSALSLPDRNSAIRFLSDALPSLETQLPGISNEGLLSLHELTHGARSRPDWGEAAAKAQTVLGKSKKELIYALGFTCRQLDNLTELLPSAKNTLH